MPYSRYPVPAHQIDDSRWPLVVVRFDGAMSDPEFEKYLAGVTEILERGSTNYLIFDTTKSAAPTAKQRKRQADWITEHTAMIKRHSAGTAYVIPSALLRGMLTAILWLSPSPVEHVVVSTMREAEQVARQKLAARGVALAV